jgi:GntR family transcriptional regulator
MNVFPFIDRTSPVPIYHQLKESIYKLIADGYLKVGQRMPSIRRLSQDLGIAPMTVREAIRALVEENVLAVHQGKGTYVLAPKLRENAATLVSFTSEMKRQGIQPSSSLLGSKETRLSEEMAEVFGQVEGMPVYHLERLRLADGHPMAMQHSYIPTEVCPGLLQKDLSGSLVSILGDDYGLDFDHATQSLTAEVASTALAKQLDLMPGDAILCLERTSYTSGNLPVEFLRSYYRGDKYNLVINLKRPQ